MRTALALILALALPAVAEAKAVKNFQRVVPIAPNGRVSLDSHNGDIVVTSWDQPNVSIEARIEQSPWEGTPEEVAATEIKVTASPDSVRIVSDYSKVPERGAFFGFGKSRSTPPVYYTIRMPADAHLAVSVHNAGVRANGLRNGVRIDTHNGKVVARGISGPADIDTHNGNVDLEFVEYSRESSVSTHNGSLRLALPANAKLSLRTSAHREDVLDSEFPVTISGGAKRRATINGGGPEFTFSSHNGGIDIVRR